MARRGLVVLPFIEPGAAGGAELAQKGLDWLIAHEGGTSEGRSGRVQAGERPCARKDEAARLPRADVYGGSLAA